MSRTLAKTGMLASDTAELAVRLFSIGGGTSEIMREIIAKELRL